MTVDESRHRLQSWFMSKVRVVVLEVVSGNLTVSAAARTYGLSRQHVHRLLKRYREGGLEAVDPRSRRPASNPRAVSDEVIVAIVTLREQLTADGLDAGPLTLQWHLQQRGLAVPSTSTIRRILHHHSLITPQPRKRPKSSYRRFEASQPNECWPSDFTHWPTAPTSRSCPGSTTTPATCWRAPPTRASPSATWWPASPTPPPPTACPPLRLPTTDRSTRHDSPTATTTSKDFWPVWASPRKTGTP